MANGASLVRKELSWNAACPWHENGMVNGASLVRKERDNDGTHAHILPFIKMLRCERRNISMPIVICLSTFGTAPTTMSIAKISPILSLRTCFGHWSFPTFLRGLYNPATLSTVTQQIPHQTNLPITIHAANHKQPANHGKGNELRSDSKGD
jgi:hypothetical protein